LKGADSKRWVAERPWRALALRWSLLFLLAWLVELGLATFLGRTGLVAQLLAPSASLLTLGLALVGIFLLALRITRVIVLPVALAVAWTLALLPMRPPKSPSQGR
jgi:hypothetical protein